MPEISGSAVISQVRETDAAASGGGKISNEKETFYHVPLHKRSIAAKCPPLLRTVLTLLNAPPLTFMWVGALNDASAVPTFGFSIGSSFASAATWERWSHS